VPIVVQLWFWMTPIIYMKEMIADKYPSLLTYNPFFYFSDSYQNIFLYSQSPSLNRILLIILMTTVMLFIAGFLYKKMIGTIKDII
jgi:lipopolysaccharide transport system permease protein